MTIGEWVLLAGQAIPAIVVVGYLLLLGLRGVCNAFRCYKYWAQ